MFPLRVNCIGLTSVTFHQLQGYQTPNLKSTHSELTSETMPFIMQVSVMQITKWVRLLDSGVRLVPSTRSHTHTHTRLEGSATVYAQYSATEPSCLCSCVSVSLAQCRGLHPGMRRADLQWLVPQISESFAAELPPSRRGEGEHAGTSSVLQREESCLQIKT